MPRRKSVFCQQDVARALRAAKAAGLEVSAYEIDRSGKITVKTVSGARAVSTAEIALEEWIAENARKTARNQPRP